jgi:predicted site-specific integrase-resolvase
MGMDGEPKGMLLRRRHVLDWLGIDPWLFSQWKTCGILRPVYVGGKKPFYLKDEIKKLVEDAKDERKRTD